jgi:hypothetical protein
MDGARWGILDKTVLLSTPGKGHSDLARLNLFDVLLAVIRAAPHDALLSDRGKGDAVY